MTSAFTCLCLRFQFHILPILLIIMGIFCLGNRHSISCTIQKYNAPGAPHGEDGTDAKKYASTFENYCPEKMLLPRPLPAPTQVPHPGVDRTKDFLELEKRKVPLHSFFGLMLLIWAWGFYATGEFWKYMEGSFVKNLQHDKAPQKRIAESPGKCRLYLIKYLLVLALAIVQLILFMMTVSFTLMGKIDAETLDLEHEYLEYLGGKKLDPDHEYLEYLEHEYLESSKSKLIAIAQGEHVLPMMAECFMYFERQIKYDAQCHLDFNENLEMIYIFCMMFSIISMIHLVMAFLHTIIVTCVNLLQVLHICLCGSYTWSEARECLAREEMLSGRWLLLQ